MYKKLYAFVMHLLCFLHLTMRRQSRVFFSKIYKLFFFLQVAGCCMGISVRKLQKERHVVREGRRQTGHARHRQRLPHPGDAAEDAGQPEVAGLPGLLTGSLSLIASTPCRLNSNKLVISTTRIPVYHNYIWCFLLVYFKKRKSR